MTCPHAAAHSGMGDQFVDDSELTIHLMPNYDLSLAPIKGSKLREWWEKDNKTRNHAKFCLPITMASAVGYYLLSPATFEVTWDGDEESAAKVEIQDAASHAVISTHSANGSFTVQTQFVAKTKKPGDFIMVCDFINGYRKPYNFMGACVEGWWNNANFGLVAMLNQAGTFQIQKGEPLAHMFVLKAAGANAPLVISKELPPDHIEWNEKRCRHGKWKEWKQPEQEDRPAGRYTGKDLDYLKGRKPDLTPVQDHILSWKTKVILPPQ